MAEGPGRYDAACTALRKHYGGKATIIAVLDGNLGTGFSIQLSVESKAEAVGVTLCIASALRSIADEVEKDAETLNNNLPDIPPRG